MSDPWPASTSQVSRPNSVARATEVLEAQEPIVEELVTVAMADLDHTDAPQPARFPLRELGEAPYQEEDDDCEKEPGQQNFPMTSQQRVQHQTDRAERRNDGRGFVVCGRRRRPVGRDQIGGQVRSCAPLRICHVVESAAGSLSEHYFEPDP